MNTWPYPGRVARDAFEFYDELGIDSAGLPRQFGREYLHQARFFQVKFEFSQAEAAGIHEFFSDNLNAWFLMELPSATGMVEQKVRLISDLTVVHQNPNGYISTFSMERYGQFSTELEFPADGSTTYEEFGISYEEVDYIYGGMVLDPPIVLDATPDFINDLEACVGNTLLCPNPATIVSTPVTISASGGNGTYTHAWTYVSGTVLTVDSPTSGTTTFSKSLAHGASSSSVYRDTVTSNGNVETIDVAIDLEYTYTASSLSLSVTPDPLDKTFACTGSLAYCFSPQYVTTDAATVAVGGGSGTITCLWEYVSGDIFTINSPTNLTTTFSSAIVRDDVLTGVVKCTVTRGGVTNVIELTVTIEYDFTLDTGGGGPPGGGGDYGGGSELP